MFLLFDGIVILALLATPVNWVKLEESESSTFAAGRADAGASSGLHDNWNDIGSWADNVVGSNDVFLLDGRDRRPPFWHGWIRGRGDWSEDQEVRWSSLLKSAWDTRGWFFGERKESRVSADHSCVMRHSRMRSVNWLRGSWSK